MSITGSEREPVKALELEDTVLYCIAGSLPLPDEHENADLEKVYTTFGGQPVEQRVLPVIEH